jgi:chromosome segregation ATPase
MNARVSAAAIWISAVVLAGGGAVAASNGFRHAAELAEQRDAAAAEAARAGSELATLRADAASLRDVLAFERRERQSLQRMLVMTRSLLQDSLDQLQQVQGKGTLLARENAMLRACLAGTLQALPLLGDGNSLQAMHIMMTVDAPCRAAQQALFVKPASADR